MRHESRRRVDAGGKARACPAEARFVTKYQIGLSGMVVRVDSGHYQAHGAVRPTSPGSRRRRIRSRRAYHGRRGSLLRVRAIPRRPAGREPTARSRTVRPVCGPIYSLVRNAGSFCSFAKRLAGSVRHRVHRDVAGAALPEKPYHGF